MPLSLELSTDKTVYAPGESIFMHMVLKNESDKTEILPNFTYNSDLTELLVYDSDGELVAKLNDYSRLEMLEVFAQTPIKPPQDSVRGGQIRELSWDLSQYIRLTKSGKYTLQVQYKYYDKELFSEPLEIEILEGDASGLIHSWQYESGDRSECHFLYKEGDHLMHMTGLDHNPEVLGSNLMLDDNINPDQFMIPRSFYDQDDFIFRMLGVGEDRLFGYGYRGEEIVSELDTVKLNGQVVASCAVETFKRTLVVPEFEQGYGMLKLHLFSGDGKKIRDKGVEIGSDAKIFTATSFVDQTYFFLYTVPAEKGFTLNAVIAEKDDFADLKAIELYKSETELLTAVFPYGIRKPLQVFAVSFDKDPKELSIHAISLDSSSKSVEPAKQILKSAGELEFYEMVLDASGRKYMLFIEEGHKLLYYNHTKDEFQFITEDKYSDPQLIVTPSNGVFLAYEDKDRIVRFEHVEKVMKKH